MRQPWHTLRAWARKNIHFPQKIALLLAVLVLLLSAAPVMAQAPEVVDDASSVTILEQKADAAGVHTTMRIEIAKDSFLSSAAANTNFGAASTMELGWVAGRLDAARILIEFGISQIPPDATIDGAQLFIYQAGSVPFNDAAMTFRAQYMQNSWAEGGVTWNNANYLGGDVLPLGTVDNSGGWKTTNVTDLVRVWYSGARPNYGLIITGDEIPSNNRSRLFYTKERSGFAPYVIVDYTVSCDNVPPQAFVEALPQYSPGKYRVTWGGQDFAPPGCPPTGIAYYDVDFRINGGSWQRWKNQTQATFNTFKDWADNGDTVEFRARAADNAGNIQDFGNPTARTTVDKEPPIARVADLPEYTVTPSFTISWSGTDNLSGIANYDVQFRENGGAWQWLFEETTLTSFLVTGAQSGSTYDLRARATDNVGNSQEWDDVPQTSTTVFDYPVSVVLPFNPPILKPTATITDSFQVSWTSYFAPGLSISTYDVYVQYNGGTWQLWKKVPGNVTSDIFEYGQVGGDGVYGFEAVATNNLGTREPQLFQAESTMLVDLADVVHPRAYLAFLAASTPPDAE